MIDVAAELNEAYTELQPLDKLLRKHRVYALARAPLSDRIPILRAIAQQDSKNPVWLEDVKSYEQARFEEFKQEIQTATKKDNFRRIKDLHREINSADWHTSPPESLMKKVALEFQRLQEKTALQRLTQLEPQINNAFADFDLNQMRQLKTDWDRHLQLVSTEKIADLHPLVQPAFEWLEDELGQAEKQDALQRSLAELEAAIDDESTKPSELSRLMNVAERFDEPIPERTRIRFNERIRTHDVRAKQKMIAMVVGFVTTILVLAGIVVFLVIWSTNAANIVERSTRLINCLTMRILTKPKNP